MAKQPTITPGATPMTFEEFREGGFTFAGGFKGFQEAQRLATENEAAKRAGADIKITKPTLQTGQSATSRGRQFKTPTAVVESVVPTKTKAIEEDRFAGMPDWLRDQLLAEEARVAQEGVVEEELRDINVIAEEYGLELGEETIGGVVKKFKEEQAEELTAAEKKVAMLKELDVAQTKRFSETAEGAKGATEAAFAQGREGAMASTAKALRTEFITEMDKRIGEANTRLQLANDQRDKFILDLEKAQKAGQKKLAESIKKSLGAAQVKIDEAKTNYLNALTTANQEARLAEASTRQNLQSFTDLVNKGTELNNASLISIADSLNIPTETALGYYEGAEAIRAEKGLSVAEKQLKLNDLAFTFDEKIQGIRGEQAQAINDFTKLSQSGNYTQAQLAQFATAMNIPNDQNPLYLADIKLKQSNAIIAEKEANGVAITPEDRLDQYKAQAELNRIMGITGEAFVPRKSLEGIEVTYDNGEYNVNTPKNAKYQCGEAVNRTWGLASAGDSGMGNSYESKQKTVDERGILATNITDPQAQIKPGMAFVMPIGGNVADQGHCGIVTSVNSDGTFQSVEFNANGDEKRTEQIREISQMYGFSAPPNSSIEGGEGTEVGKLIKQFIDEGFSPEKARDKAEEQVEKRDLNKKKIKLQIDENQIAIDTVDTILATLSPFSPTSRTALGRTVGQLVPGSAARDIAADLDTLKAIVGFEKLQAMRAASPTGGALGQVSEMENKLLQSTKGSLDIGQSNEKFIKNLNQVKSILERINAAGKEDIGEGGKDLIQVTRPDEIESIFSGISKALHEGIPEQEIINSLRNQGIDPYVFFNR
jgi:hypothetical protein